MDEWPDKQKSDKLQDYPSRTSQSNMDMISGLRFNLIIHTMFTWLS